MAFFGNQFSDVVEWEEFRDDMIFWKWTNKEIKKGSRLIIRPGQDAIFLNNGKIEGIFEQEGEYDIVSERVQNGVALVGCVGCSSCAGDRIIGKDQAIHPGTKRAQVEDRVRLNLNQHAPVHPGTFIWQPEDEFCDEVPMSVLDRCGDRRQR